MGICGWAVRDRRTIIPEHVTVTEKFLKFMDKLRDKPSLIETLKPEDEYKPEVVFFMNSPKSDSSGLCHFMHVHPDGKADYVGFNPELMDHPTRWIMCTGEQEALGVALPSTCDPEGYTAEKKKGNIRQIPGGTSVNLAVKTGVFDRKETSEMERHISDWYILSCSSGVSNRKGLHHLPSFSKLHSFLNFRIL